MSHLHTSTFAIETALYKILTAWAPLKALGRTVLVCSGPDKMPDYDLDVAVTKVRSDSKRATYGCLTDEGTFEIVADAHFNGSGESAIQGARLLCEHALDAVLDAISPDTGGDPTLGGVVLKSGDTVTYETVDNYLLERGSIPAHGYCASMTVSWLANNVPGVS